MGIDNPVHLIFLAAVALLVLGPKRLPEVARSVGKGIRDFREAMSVGADDLAPAPEQPPLAEVVDPAPSVDPARQVDPGEPVRSGDAPDRRPL